MTIFLPNRYLSRGGTASWWQQRGNFQRALNSQRNPKRSLSEEAWWAAVECTSEFFEKPKNTKYQIPNFVLTNLIFFSFDPLPIHGFNMKTNSVLFIIAVVKFIYSEKPHKLKEKKSINFGFDIPEFQLQYEIGVGRYA